MHQPYFKLILCLSSRLGLRVEVIYFRDLRCHWVGLGVLNGFYINIGGVLRVFGSDLRSSLLISNAIPPNTMLFGGIALKCGACSIAAVFGKTPPNC